MIEILFSDLDGTFWIDTKDGIKVKKEDIEAVKDSITKGLDFAIATGRGKNAIEDVEKMIGHKLDGVTMNGSGIWIDDKLSKKWFIDNETILEIIDQIKDKWSCFMHMHVGENGRGTLVVKVGDPSPEALIWPHKEIYDIDYLRQNKVEIYKVTILALDPYDRDEYQNDLRHPNTRSLINQLKNIELVPYFVSKGQAIAEYCKMKGIDPSTVAFIGDEVNDVEAMRFARLSFAMDTSKDAVKKEAMYVVSGVKEAIDRIWEFNEREIM